MIARRRDLYFSLLFSSLSGGQVIDKRAMDPKLKPLLVQFHVEIQARTMVHFPLGHCRRSSLVRGDATDPRVRRFTLVRIATDVYRK